MSMNSGNNPAGMAAANQIFGKYVTESTAPNIFRMGPGGTNANINFPVQIGSTDPDDYKYALQRQLVAGNAQGVIPGVGQAIAGPDFFKYAERKDAMQMLLNYKQYVYQQADLSTPEKAQWWFDQFPWMKDERLEQINKNSELQKKFAHIAVIGPQNEEDMILLYLREKGQIQVPNLGVHLLGVDDSVTTASGYQAGFFSPLSKQPVPQGLPVGKSKIPWNNPINGDWTNAGWPSGWTAATDAQALTRP